MIRQKRKLRHLLIFGILTPLLACMGCSSDPEPVIDTVPGWLESIPQDQNHYYAIGISGATPRVTDAWDQAIRRARAELGRVMISHVTSKDTIISTSSGEYVKEIVKILSDTELNYTEVIERWADRSGVYGPPGHFYVLVRIEKMRAESVLRSVR
ncbi:MAG: LPP20 family lipoprotein [Deltaproteobacteria bacterium]|nr:MAG: LPP20 family lipoprotein [Deltaproteobacteria bacterium]